MKWAGYCFGMAAHYIELLPVMWMQSNLKPLQIMIHSSSRNCAAKTPRRQEEKDGVSFLLGVLASWRRISTSWLRVFVVMNLLLAGTNGCARLSAGPIQAINPSPQICLIRGFQDWYSTGIDQLSSELKSNNIPSQVYQDEQWRDIAAALLENHSGPIVLIGFSYGADDVISIARRLNENHLTVTLLITIDPVTPDAVPANVVRCVNFYEPNGFWDIFPWLRGVPLQRENAKSDGIENINIRRRLDLVEPNTSHATIAANAKVHRAIIDLVSRAL
jgi:pimeloyl-ACP methyl ester carboxylesterase